MRTPELEKKYNKQRFTVRDPDEVKFINSLLKKEMKRIDKYDLKLQMLICHLYGKVNDAAIKLTAKA